MTDYPRPDFVRQDLTWQSLNGTWSFLFDDDDVGLQQSWHLKGVPQEINVKSSETGYNDSTQADSITAKIIGNTQEILKSNHFKPGATLHRKRDIQVPYVFQCPASGINEQGVHEVLWYEREVTDLRSEEQKSSGSRLIIRFGAVDYEAKVWLDGHYFGGHRGGHVPFDIDITDAFANGQTQRLTMRVFDSAHDLTQPRGKQYWRAQPESIFYTPSSGIWQNVWLEVVPEVRIGDSSSGTLLRSNDIISGQLHSSVSVLGRPAGQKYSVQLDVSLYGQSISQTQVELPRNSNEATLTTSMRLSDDMYSQQPANSTSENRQWLNNVALWSPEYPTLYDITIRLLGPTDAILDTITTTTGMRSLHWDNSTFRLNNRPYFQALFLDQGYWPNTFMTPPSTSSLKHDILLSKAMGFNGCRKHQKLEDPTFHYWADRLGFLIWSEMASAYSFSPSYTSRFDKEWKASVLRDRNHPSVVAWTTANESWAYTHLAHSVQQRDHLRSLYYATKVLDPTRPVNDNCGWEHVKTDLTTFHDYADGVELARTCASLQGILKAKADRPTFVGPIGTADAGAEHRADAPILCTEFGGINIARSAAGAGEGADRDWGYTTATDPKDLLKRIEKMMTGIVDGGLVCGFVYTQLTDIEQEVNGLYTPDRKAKLDAAEMKRIVERVIRRYDELQK
ncbi:hypothetical protein ACN47E_009174 [Coniothyrium glycines]